MEGCVLEGRELFWETHTGGSHMPLNPATTPPGSSQYGHGLVQAASSGCSDVPRLCTCSGLCPSSLSSRLSLGHTGQTSSAHLHADWCVTLACSWMVTLALRVPLDGQCISVGLLGTSLRCHLLRPSSHSAGYLLDVFMVTQLIFTLSNSYTFPLLVAAVDCLVTSEARPIFNR